MPGRWAKAVSCFLAVCVIITFITAAAGRAGENGTVREGKGPVWVIELADTINPATSHYLGRGLEEAAKADAACVVIRLDTPGGLVDSMRRMVKAIIACPVPIVVFVGPPGARAASAGAFLVLAANISAMAPATNIGAAHPVGAGGKDIEGAMAGKVVKDLSAMAESLAKRKGVDTKLVKDMVTESASYDSVQAEEKGLVEIISRNLGELLTKLHGRVVATATGKARIVTAGKNLFFFKPGARERLLSFLANPSLAYILMMIGMMGLFFELSNPGSIFPGVVGGLCLILALFSMSTLSVSYTGLALIGLSVVLFIMEIKVTSMGLLSLAGASCLVLGSIMLFDSPDELARVSLSVLVPTIIGVLAFFLGATYLAAKAQMAKGVAGAEGMVGARGVATGPAKVRVMGELWNAQSEVELEKGREVVVTGMDGLTLIVEQTDAETRGEPEQ